MSKPSNWQDSDRVKYLLDKIQLLSKELDIRLGGYIYVYRLSDNKLIWVGGPESATDEG